MSLPVLSFLNGAPHRRAPLPGEFFFPSDLVADWWRAVFWGLVLVFVGSAAMWGVLKRRDGPTPRRRARIEVDARELRIHADDAAPRRVALTDIEHVFNREGTAFGADEPPATTLVRLRDGEVLAIEHGPGQRGRLARRLVPDATRHGARVPAGSIATSIPLLEGLSKTFFVVCYFMLLIALGAAGETLFRWEWSAFLARLPFVAAFLGSLGLLWPLLRSRRVVVGADGVRIEGLLRSRFIPLDRIAGVRERTDEGVTLQLEPAMETVEIPGVAGGGGLEERIALAVRARKAGGERESVEVRGLGRDGRSPERWRADLKRLTGDSSYRSSSVRIADLEAVLDAPAADPEHRVGAAVALSSDEAAKSRIRIAANATADPDLQAALEAAAEGELSASHVLKAQARFTSTAKGGGAKP